MITILEIKSHQKSFKIFRNGDVYDVWQGGSTIFSGSYSSLTYNSLGDCFLIKKKNGTYSVYSSTFSKLVYEDYDYISVDHDGLSFPPNIYLLGRRDSSGVLGLGVGQGNGYIIVKPIHKTVLYNRHFDTFSVTLDIEVDGLMTEQGYHVPRRPVVSVVASSGGVVTGN